MQKLQGIAVSPGVAIGEALVMDNEGFRIPRRFVARDAVEDELERLEAAMAAAGAEIDAQPRTPSRASSASNTPPSSPPTCKCSTIPTLRGRAREHDPRAALLARVRRQPRPAPLRQGLSDHREQLPGRAGQRHLRHREAPAAQPAGPPARGAGPRHLAGDRAGPQPHAQRDGQPQPRSSSAASSPRSAAPAATRPSSPKAWRFRPSSAPDRS